ncbi:putative Subtilisin [Microcystis aeruginosa PCC 9701]|uniref:Putative Subtilisin n=1 Tax=Microcystis aeruginosa PCC 9701 TaxID=721123 RepID=I4IX41_MICAE|nr:putative Subtilisin [Microcystis aeruginosa PCC 9701]
MVTDGGNAVYERLGEINNVNYDGFSTEIIIPPPSDLVVTGVTVPASGIPGQAISLSYTVQNQGTESAYGSWTDAVYLSADNQWDIGDVLVGQVNRSGDVATGASYTETLNGVVPGVNLGDYYVLVRSDIRNQVPEVNEGNNTGVSNAKIALDVEALTLGTPDTGDLDQGQSVYYRFNATAGQAIRLKLDSSSDQSLNELYVRYGAMPTRGQFDWTTTQPFNTDPEIIIPIEQTGTYYVLGYGDQVSGSPSYEILAQEIPFSITDVASRKIGNFGEATLEIRGARFSTDTTFQLRAADGSLITAENIYLENSTLAYVTFDLFNETLGLYDVQANQGNSTARLEDVITVQDASGFDLDSNITGPEEVRPNRNYTFNVNYGNTGDTDAIAPLLIIESVTNTQVGTTLEGLTSDAPLHLLGVSNEGPQGILRPGDINVLPVYFNSNTAPIEFQVRTYSADNTTAIDWNSFEVSIRPEGLTDAQWDSFLSNIVSRVQTYGDYVKMLNDMSSQLSAENEPIYDVKDLFARMYAVNPEYQPSSNLSGQLLDAETAIPLAGVELAAYETRGEDNRLVGTAITDQQGNFTFISLESGSYELALSDYDFDMDRNGETDLELPIYEINANSDQNVVIYGKSQEEVSYVNETNPVLTRDSKGTTHIIWSRDGNITHAFFNGSNWVTSNPIPEATGTDFTIRASDNLINGTTPGLIVSWKQGEGNESEIYYSIGRQEELGNTYEWTTPTSLTNNTINDSNPSLVVTQEGEIVTVYQKYDSEIGDDKDLYYDSFLISSNNLYWSTNNNQFLTSTSEDLTTLSSFSYSINIGKSISIPKVIPFIGGKTGIELSGTISGQLGENPQLNGELEGSAQLSKRLEGAVNGAVEANWKINKEECEYEFESASLNVGGSLSGAIGPSINEWELNIGGYEIIEIEGIGLFLDGGISGTATWNSQADFPSWPSGGDVSLNAGLRIGAEEVELFDKVEGVLTGSGVIEVQLLPTPEFKEISASITASGRWGNHEISYTYEWSKEFGGSSIFGILSDENNILPDGLTIVYDPQTGTNNIYGTNSVSNNLQDDFSEDAAPSIAISSSGEILLAWAKENSSEEIFGDSINISTFNGTTWSNPIQIPDSLGYIGQVSLMYDVDNNPVVAWTAASSSGISTNSSAEDVYQTIKSGDVFYAVQQNGIWSSPIADLQRSGDDTSTKLHEVINGLLPLTWINNLDGNERLMSSFWNGNSWSSPQVIVDHPISGSVSLSEINGNVFAFWAEDVNPSDTNLETSIFYSSYDTTWSTPELFNPDIVESLVISNISNLETDDLVIQGISLPKPREEYCECKEGDPECDDDDDDDDDNDDPPYKPRPVQPSDPNDILGPEGFGEDRWIDTDEPLRYTIRFENVATATAPAQEVFITQQLDADLDWRTFRVDDYGWSGAVYELEGNRAFHSTRIDLTETQGFYVDIAATIDTLTGIATWRISTVDPTTGEAPLDAQQGFLPTNDENGRGEGFVTYSIRPKSTAKTGDVIDAEAEIIFDTEEPIKTPPIFNTLDTDKPTSQINSLPETTDNPQFLVSWTGSDTGSALANYTIYVSDNGGDYTPWLTNSTLTESIYQGQLGHTYRFYALATDNVGNTQEIPTTAQATIRVTGGVGTIGDFVWLDANADGIQNPGELGIANVTVKLYENANTLIATATTDATGSYDFDNITSGEYYLEFTAPEGYLLSPLNQGSDDTLDSDVDPSTAKTVNFTVNAGENLSWDAGLYQLASITGQTWNDVNGDGVKQSTELGLSVWTVYLDTNNNGQLDTGETSTQTDINGNYTFNDLRPGTYTVAQIVRDGWQQTYPIFGVSTTGSSVSLAIPTLDFIVPFTDGPTELNFSAANYLVTEDGTALAEIVVSRSGNLAGTVSATLTFADGTATGCGCAASSVNNDFNHAPITVTFAANELSKVITVQNALLNTPNTIRIRNDAKVEGDEYFTLQLTNATNGAVIGNQSLATVTIVDDESPSNLLNSSPTANTNIDLSSALNSNALSLLNLNDFWADSRFANITGQGYSTVIIDTGIDLNHHLFGPDLDNNGIADKIIYQYDFADNDNNASDKNNHGSHVASIVSSVAPDANLIVLKVFKDSGSGSFAHLEKALQWVNSNAETYNIASVNLSLGDSQNWTTEVGRYGIGDELAAIANQNILVAAAAGNSFYTFNSTPGLSYPAADPNVISVGAVWADDFGSRTFGNGAVDYATFADAIASFSQRHPLLDVFAPGILITGANATGGTISMGGTSQATPYISAIATLSQQIAQTYLERELTLTEFKTLLDTTSDLIIDGDNEADNVVNTGSSYPRVNVLAIGEAILTLGAPSQGSQSANTGNDGAGDSPYTPVNTVSLVHTVTLSAGQALENLNFGNQEVPNTDLTGLDIDGNGQYDALSDGVLLLRYLFGGFEGDDLINGAVATNAPRNLTEINTYLQTSIERGYFDIDGNGVVDALSDGIIAMRHLFGGFEGNTLIDGAISTDATRDLAGVQSYLNTLTIL